MEHTTFTEFTLADDNEPFGERIKNKDKELTWQLLQKSNGLDLG